MLIPYDQYEDLYEFQLKTNNPISNWHLDESKMGHENILMGELEGKDLYANFAQENGFFKGILFAFPVSIVLWGIIMLVIKLSF